jgi:hypothetical protein
MANTLIEQTALEIMFGGDTDKLDYALLVEALKDGKTYEEAMGNLWDTVFLCDQYEDLFFDPMGIVEELHTLVGVLTKFAGDVLASV